MIQFLLELELLEDTIFTARSATVGAPQSLDYVPGATLYGACAAKLYSSLSVAEQFAVFHSGCVRFGNGLPCNHAGEVALPMPLSWHVEKGTEPFHAMSKKQLVSSKIYNSLKLNKATDKQLKQLRQGYVNKYGELRHPATTFRMKTAINPFTDTAAEAQLFGYAAIQAGQRFNATLEIDEDRLEPSQSDHIIKKIVKAISGQLRLGRSRSSQYGTVECTVVDTESIPLADVHCDDGLVLWLLSDAALRDVYGQPTLTVSSQALGLSSSLTVNWQKTFVRTRQYSPYNAKRQCYDQERQVITQGSVISFDLPSEGLSAADITQLNRGIGDYLHSGLGKVLIQPALLADTHPKFEKRVKNSAADSSQVITMPDTDLTRWLRSIVNQSNQQSNTRAKAQVLLKELEVLYKSAHAFAAVDECTFIGPGKSQWSRVAALARWATGDKLEQGLDSIIGLSKDGDSISCTDADWAVETGMDVPSQTFGHWLIHQYSKKEISENELLILATLALDLVDDFQSDKLKLAESKEAEDA